MFSIKAVGIVPITILTLERSKADIVFLVAGDGCLLDVSE